jgi:hypothetical protein
MNPIKIHRQLAPVAHVWNSATQEVKVRRILVQGQSRKNISEIPISTNIWVQWYTSVTQVHRKLGLGRSVPGQHGQKSL